MRADIITDEDRLKELVAYVLRQDAFAFDVETVGAQRNVPKVNEVTWISIATYGRTVIIPMGHPNGNRLISKARRQKNKETGQWVYYPAVFSAPPPQLSRELVFEILRPLFFGNGLVKIAHNATFDMLSIAKYYGGRYPDGPYGDTIVAAWLLNENRMLGLKMLVKARYGLDYDTENVGKCVEIHEFWKVAKYGWLDARMDWLLWRHYRSQLAADEKLENVWNLEMRVLGCLLHMQSQGMHVDQEAMEALRVELRGRLVHVEAAVYQAAGTVFNLGSVPQKQALLYGPDGACLTPKKLTTGGLKKQQSSKPLTFKDYSTDDDALKSHRGHPLVDSILEYQELAKIKQTYLDGYLGTEEKPSIIFDGRVYPVFSQYGTVTGRFSGRSPNLQNIPARGDVGKKIRDFFPAPPGHKLLIADYGQIELRILAHYCANGKLYQGFMDGLDAHTVTACAVFGVTPDKVTKEMRQVAKALAFAIIYGAGIEKVAAMAGISEKKAAAFLKTHEREFPEIYEFRDRLLAVASAREIPHIRTLLGRFRRLPDLRSPVFKKRKAAERQLTNSVCQGGNADIIKLAMARLNEARPEWFQIHLTVHDELICSAPEEKAQEGAEILKWAMVGDGIQELLRVPIITDVKICDRWSEGKD